MNNDYSRIAPMLAAESARFGAAGCYSVSLGGETLAELAFGFEDRAHTVPMTLDSRFCTLLECKYILGVVLCALADRKLLKLNDRLSRFVPEYAHADRITLKQLLTERAGVPDYVSLIRADIEKAHPELSSAERYPLEVAAAALTPTAAELIERINGLPLTFEPGKDCDFENHSDMKLLAAALERASGCDLYALAQELVFEPAGMVTEEGDTAPTCTAVCLNGVEIPVEHTPACRVFTTDGRSVLRLCQALADKKLFSEAGWTAMERLCGSEEDGYGAFSNTNGTFSTYTKGPFGYELCLYFTVADRQAWANVLSEQQPCLIVDSSIRYFRPAVRCELEGIFQRYTAPKISRVNKKNIWDALDLEIEPHQLNFVMAPKDSIAFAAVDRNCKAYVAEDCGRPVGLLVLTADKRKDFYEVSILLVDRRYQGRGYGRFLLEFGIKRLTELGAKTLEIGVNRDNPAARGLYESCGFKPTEYFESGITLKLEIE